MGQAAIFFDRDNTLIVNDGYLGDPARVRLMDGAADAVAGGRAMGYAIVVFTNQSGVARGLFDEAAVRAVNARMEQLLRAANGGAIIDRQEYCPYHPQAALAQYRRDSDLRKPGAGMIRKAAEALSLDLPQSWVIGDALRDIEAGKKAGCGAILFHPPGISSAVAESAQPAIVPDHTAESLLEAIGWIEQERRRRTATP